jgi:hypothetical protein
MLCDAAREADKVVSGELWDAVQMEGQRTLQERREKLCIWDVEKVKSFSTPPDRQTIHQHQLILFARGVASRPGWKHETLQYGPCGLHAFSCRPHVANA